MHCQSTSCTLLNVLMVEKQCTFTGKLVYPPSLLVMLTTLTFVEGYVVITKELAKFNSLLNCSLAKSKWDGMSTRVIDSTKCFQSYQK